ncbi:disrupted in schizophrenia 1, putative [Babesia ovis]|uniref:Disrupted in schizophrenia 1, putative n=1 Tax=Babesia ovis TaxID=5869 RepID=A0A9W5TCY1_BABOV|nr:disrupted in schizophrenia 1, putative [Babesia ovis]
MAITRQDRVNVLKNFIMMAFIGFSSFMSSDFIRLIVFETIKHEAHWIFVYQMMTWWVTVAAMFVKIPAAASLRYCLRYNALFLCVTTLIFYMKWYESISFHLILVFWAYLVGLSLVNAIYLASYDSSGVKGISIGVMVSFLFTYVVLDIMKRVVWYKQEIGNYRYIVVIFLMMKIGANFGAMYLVSSVAREHHLDDYDAAFKYLTSGVLLEWLSGTLHDRDVTMAIRDVVPRCVTPMEGFIEIFRNMKVTILWVLFVALTFTCSLFTPYVGASHWDLSIFKMGQLERAEHLGNLLGVILACIRRKGQRGMIGIGVWYFVHLVLSLFLTAYTHSYVVSRKVEHDTVLSLTAINAILGSYLTIIIFDEFFKSIFDTSCKQSAEQEHCVPCCIDDETDACLCTEQFCKEKCGRDPQDHNHNSEKKRKIHIPPCIKEMYKLWDPEFCLLCWLYRHNPDEVCKTAKDGDKGPCNNSDNEKCNGNCEHLLLRNCKVSLCAYCDMNLLLECEKIQCTCTAGACMIPLPNANMYKEDDEYKEALLKNGNGEAQQQQQVQQEQQQPCVEAIENTTDEKPIKIPLHEMLLGDSVSLVTTSSSEIVIPKSTCCKNANVCKENAESLLGKDFTISSICCYSCCHYDLKVMVKCKDPSTGFSMMEAPYTGKFDAIGAIVFNGCCTGEKTHKSKMCPPSEKKNNILDAREVNNSLTYACSMSKVVSVSRLPCDDAFSGDNGLAACCKQAVEAKEKKREQCKQQQQQCKKQLQEPQVQCPPCRTSGAICDPQCCHMKVKPTAYPFQFRKKDLLRSSIVSAFFTIVLVFALGKLLTALVFALLELKYGLDLTTNFKLIEPFYKQSEDETMYMPYKDMDENRLLQAFLREMSVRTSKYAELVDAYENRQLAEKRKTVKSREQEIADYLNRRDISYVGEFDVYGLAYMNEVVEEPPPPAAPESKENGALDEDDEDDDDDIRDHKPLVKHEYEQMTKVLKQYKRLCNKLEYAYVKNWVDENIKLKVKENVIEKVKKIRRIKWCLESGLKEYAFNSAGSITSYLNSYEDKWETEWNHYLTEIERKIELTDSYAALMAPKNNGRVINPALQVALRNAKIENMNNVLTDAETLVINAERLETRQQELNEASGGANAIEKLILLWAVRVQLLGQLTNEGYLFLGWRPFIGNWDKIMSWKDYFMPLYIKEYENMIRQNSENVDAKTPISIAPIEYTRMSNPQSFNV